MNGKPNQKKALIQLLESDTTFDVRSGNVEIFKVEDGPRYYVDTIDETYSFDEVTEAVDLFLEKISQTS